MPSRFLALLAAVCSLFSPAAFAQEARGSIFGRVTDQSGAAVPNAPVEVTNTAMGTKQLLTTNESGVYQASFLIAGRYQIVAQVPGFKKFVRSDIEVHVNDRLEINIAIEVGTPEQSVVTVVGESPQLATGTASMGQVVDGRRISELPVGHGNPYQLIGLSAGVAFGRDAKLDRPFEPTHIVGYVMDGVRANRSDVTIDGAPSTATANPGEVTASYVPPADVISEFKVQTATFDASFGQTEGGVANISIKSGTNALHGTAYWSKFVPGLFANDFFANANRIPLADFKYDRWGGSVGGPIRLPKIYDGRNKTFFLWGYEQIAESRPRNNGTPTVPTEAMKAGDFSQLLALGPNYQIYNPFTRRSVGGGRFQSDPFPGNRIPENLINPIAKNILGFFPKPLQTGNADGTQNMVNPNLPEVIDYFTHTGRIDHAFSDKNRFFVRGSWYDRNSTYNDYFGNLATGSLFQFLSRSFVADDVHVLTPTTVLNVRYGFNRFVRNDAPNAESEGFDLTTLGFPASYANSVPAHARRFPRIDFPTNTYQGTGVGADYRPNDIHSVNASIQKTQGSHFFKGGMEFRSYREFSVPQGNNQTGQFVFDANWTKGPLDNSATAPGQLGQTLASMLLGLPSTASSISRVASYAEQSTSWGFFIHDDWKITPKLTLNIGLRWEFENALTERFNQSVRGFDVSFVQPFDAAARAAYANNPTPEVPASQFRSAGGLTFAGVNGQPRQLYNTPKANLMPRFGFAYAVDNKTVVRGGYGIFYGFLGQRRGDVSLHGFTRATPVANATNDNINFTPTLSNPFPTGILEPVGASQGGQTFVGQTIDFFNPNPLMPHMQRWQLGFQRELPGGMVAEASYVGNRGTHIEYRRNLNATPLQYLGAGATRDNARIAYLSANLTNPFAGILPTGAGGAFTGAQIPRERLLRPYPQFDEVRTSQHDGYSWYHSLQTSLEKRFSRGYTLSAQYTFSKFMQATELLNAADPRPTEVISDMDYPHRLTVSGIWDIPFGRGRRYAANIGSLANVFVGGWQLNGIYTFQSGTPIQFAVTSTGGFNTPQAISFTGDVNNIKLPADQRSPAGWFNANAGFVRDAAQVIDITRQLRTFPLRFGFLRADGINNYDLSLFKNTRIRESMNVQFRAEFLNAFNRAMFPAPNTANASQVQFGTLSGAQANYPRRIQLSLKFIF